MWYNMRYESRTVMGAWKSEGRAEGFADGMAAGLLEGRRQTLLRILQLRFPVGIPADVMAFAKATTDLELLNRWIDSAVMAASAQQFEQLVTRGR
jgi:hypothetical protein